MVKRKTSSKKPPTGRPSSYKPEYDDQAYKYCLLGATDADLAKFFGVSEVTINAWKNKHESFLNSLKEGRETADSNVGNSLYQRANGYSCKEDKVFCHNGEVTVVPTTKHYPPDSTALIFWLKNRQPAKWRDKREVVADVKVTDMSEDQISEKIKSIIGDS